MRLIMHNGPLYKLVDNDRNYKRIIDRRFRFIIWMYQYVFEQSETITSHDSLSFSTN